MRRHLTAGLLAAFGVAGVAAAQDAAPEAAPEVVETPDPATVLASVNGVDITLGHAIVMLQALPAEYQRYSDEELMRGIVDQLVDQTLLAEERSAGPESDPLAVRLRLENDRRSALAALEIEGRAGGPVDEAAVDAAYQARVAAFVPATEYRAAHILVPTEQEAADIAAEILGGGDFAEIATARSTDPGSSPAGGELGWFGGGQMVPEFEAAVAALEPGQVSDPVQSPFGWHVVKLEETRATTPPPLDQVRPEIETELRRGKLEAALVALRAEAEIERPETGLAPSAIRAGAAVAD